jgi:3-oxoacyl-[acyl-carrier protein] reductase
MVLFRITPISSIKAEFLNRADLHLCPEQQQMNISLSGKHALICGSTQGIGLAIAKEFSSAGATCVLIARNKEGLEKAVSQLSIAHLQKHQYLVADFSQPSEVKQAIEGFLKNTVIHILVNNTGGPKPGMIADEDEQKFMDTFQQHVICNQVLAKAVIPGMKEARYGRIINIISTSVRIPIQNLGVSNTIRAAVASWSKTLSNEVAEFGITVNSILTGYTSTARLQSVIEANAARRGVSTEVVVKEMIDKIPMKRFGDPSETAAVAAFLASPAASFVNGVSIPVDGGGTGTI